MSDFKISYAPYAADDDQFISQQMQIANVRLRGRALNSLPSEITSEIFNRYKQRIRQFIEANQQQYRLSGLPFAHKRTTFTDPGMNMSFRFSGNLGLSESTRFSGNVGLSESVQFSGNVGLSESVQFSGDVQFSGNVGLSESVQFSGARPSILRPFPATQIDMQYINNNGQPVVHVSMPDADAFVQELEEEFGGLPEELDVLLEAEEAPEVEPEELPEEEFVEPETFELDEPEVEEPPEQPEIEEPEVEIPEVIPDEPVIEVPKDAPWGVGEVMSFLVLGIQANFVDYYGFDESDIAEGPTDTYIELLDANGEVGPRVYANPAQVRTSADPEGNDGGRTDYLTILCFYDFSSDPDAPTPDDLREAFLTAPFIQEIYEKDKILSSDNPATDSVMNFPPLKDWVNGIQFMPAKYGARVAGRAAGYTNINDDVNTYTSVDLDSVAVYELPFKMMPSIMKEYDTSVSASSRPYNTVYEGWTEIPDGTGRTAPTYLTYYVETTAFDRRYWYNASLFTVTAYIVDTSEGAISSTKTGYYYADGREITDYTVSYPVYREWRFPGQPTTYSEFVEYSRPTVAYGSSQATYWNDIIGYFPSYYNLTYTGQHDAALAAGGNIGALYGYAYPGADGPLHPEVLARAIYAENFPPQLNKTDGDIPYAREGDSNRVIELYKFISRITNPEIENPHLLIVNPEMLTYTCVAIPVGYKPAGGEGSEPEVGDVLKTPLSVQHEREEMSIDYRGNVLWTE